MDAHRVRPFDRWLRLPVPANTFVGFARRSLTEELGTRLNWLRFGQDGRHPASLSSNGGWAPKKSLPVPANGAIGRMVDRAPVTASSSSLLLEHLSCRLVEDVDLGPKQMLRIPREIPPLMLKQLLCCPPLLLNLSPLRPSVLLQRILNADRQLQLLHVLSYLE